MDNMTTESIQIDYPPMAVTSRKKLLIGCAIAIGGNLLISISLNLQKYTHTQLETAVRPTHYLRKPIWWLGLLLMVLGEVGNFSAYGFAPASMVAPLGSTSVIANMFIAILFLKEKLRPEDIFGCTFAILGAFLLVTFSAKDEYILTGKNLIFLMKGKVFIVYVIIELVAVVLLLVLRYVFRIINIVVLLLIAAILASFTVISAKAVSGMLQMTIFGYIQIQTPIFWIMLFIMTVTAIIQVKYINQAMKQFNSTTVVPTYFVLFTISAILAGVTLYKEFKGLGPVEIFMFAFGCLLCFIGVYFITVGRADARSTDIQPSPSPQPTQVVNEIFPSWLFSQVNQSEVQPRHHQYMANEVSHNEQTRPMLKEVSSSSSDYLSEDQLVEDRRSSYGDMSQLNNFH